MLGLNTFAQKSKSINLWFFFIFYCLYFLACSPRYIQKELVYRADSYPHKIPERIILNLTEQPSNSMAVTWRTDTTVTNAVAEILEAQSGPQITEKVQVFTAISQRMDFKGDSEQPINVNYHSVEFHNLEDDTKYMYRVGDGKTWSEWFHFKTAAKNDKPYSFIYLGDVQNNIKSMCSRVIREAYATCPDAGFIIYAGDLINHSGNDMEWGEWFQGGGFIHAMIPSIMTPGNHEYGKDMELDPFWRHQFTLPANGPKGLEETCFFIDYQDLRLISLDADMIDEFSWAEDAQKLWLDSVLTHKKKRWTVVMLHFPFFSTKPSRDNPQLRAVFGPIIEKHKVDLVLQGHDHAYGRGMKNIPSFVDKSTPTSTMFVVSVSGTKMYDLADRNWMTRRARNTQLFQVISVAKDTLSFQAFTATRELYDAFDLIKQPDAPNKLIDKSPPIPERLE